MAGQSLCNYRQESKLDGRIVEHHRFHRLLIFDWGCVPIAIVNPVSSVRILDEEDHLRKLPANSTVADGNRGRAREIQRRL
jgi:hypothetical protein